MLYNTNQDHITSELIIWRMRWYKFDLEKLQEKKHAKRPDFAEHGVVVHISALPWRCIVMWM